MESDPVRDLLPDFAHLHSSGFLSDITVFIKEELLSGTAEQSSPPAKRCRATQQEKSVPGHKVVLWGMSKFFQAKVGLTDIMA